MATREPPLNVILSPDATSDIEAIWRWNAKRYDEQHADSYVDFLKDNVYGLATAHEKAKPVDQFPELRNVTLKRSRKGEGHIVIFEIDEAAQVVNVLNVYHTRMDVQGRLQDQFA